MGLFMFCSPGIAFEILGINPFWTTDNASVARLIQTIITKCAVRRRPFSLASTFCIVQRLSNHFFVDCSNCGNLIYGQMLFIVCLDPKLVR